MSHDYSILPEGYHVAYVSGLQGIYYSIDEHGDQDAGYTRMYVSDAATGKDLFSIDKSQGGGDYRGFPSCVFQHPFVDASFFESVASYIWDETSDEPEPTWEDVLSFWQDLDDVMIIQFVVKDNGDDRYNSKSPYRYDFIGWLPTDNDFDLEEELENMDIPELEVKEYEVKVFVKTRGRNEDEAQQLFDELFSCELPWEIDGIEEV